MSSTSMPPSSSSPPAPSVPLNTTTLRTFYKDALKTFTASSTPTPFKILRSIPSPSASPSHSTPSNPPPRVKTLYVLDSSFYPPTKAHLHLARSAVVEHRASTPVRILLLLAIRNADKEAKPAALEERLVMMTLMGEEMSRGLNGEERGEREGGEEGVVTVDVGVTSEPFYYRKVEAVAGGGEYLGLKGDGKGDGERGEQVHIVGFDTVVRIFDPKYYPDGMGVLQGMFDRARLEVHLRNGDESEQRGYVKKIAEGKRKEEGIKADWAERIEIVDSLKDVVSSTAARSCVVDNNGEGLEKYVCESVRRYILQERLYTEDENRKDS